MKKVFDYQVVVVFNPKAEEKNREKVLAKLGTMLAVFEAKINSKEQLGTKELTYLIKKQNKGDFWKLKITATKPLDIKEINSYLNREIDVIRYLILKE
ncbi:30S ribosomal protein S6 [Candidatus Shapirobacteria bacterium CG06_land_8_20_14_3_00_40_12]|uniref:Small ribosomal subunit protein bS6 n=2 Tax=Candidatus Shapironibacteriota TaxID=1752721 RepID=A0A2M7TS68_9BACT|nr:MAG: 30S ribosomal protein S6 [Candidatus Shapirobacteria bacterium CG06_land_8_20_14_3_00_40_12]PIZ58453.1 MAG: 30S ribosomal protein S6 [Candidatus Shapirobacteria bacterium CG_4_10_14_0_2_um_filter_40_12]